MLQPLTERQGNVIEFWTSENILHGPPIAVLPLSEIILADNWGITDEAGIALLSGLVRRGWATTAGDPGMVNWHLSDEAHKALGFIPVMQSH